MSEETNIDPVVVEEVEEETKSQKQKNPNRVKAGLKLAAMGQKAKEEKMRRRVKEEMYKPTTWIIVGAILSSVGFLGLYFSPLFPKKKEKIYIPSPSEKEEKKSNYFG